jgi:hypothetical protein
MVFLRRAAPKPLVDGVSYLAMAREYALGGNDKRAGNAYEAAVIALTHERKYFMAFVAACEAEQRGHRLGNNGTERCWYECMETIRGNRSLVRRAQRWWF